VSEESPTGEAPGWDAIDAACARVHGEKKPLHFGTIVKWRLGGPDPLDGISAYDTGDHWHFVGYGLTELYGKESKNEAESGFGFELTFRLKRETDEVPPWALNFLQNLARYVATSGNRFGPGHHLNANGPIAAGVETLIEGVTFAIDPELGEIETPHGHVTFLQVVGITLDELDAMKRWRSQGVLDLMKKASPLLVTDLGRRSILEDPAIVRAVDEGAARDGSGLAETYVAQLSWERTEKSVTLTVGALAVPVILGILGSRIAHDEPFLLIGPEQAAGFKPSEKAAVGGKDALLVVEVSPSLAAAIKKTLLKKRGRYGWDELPGFFVEVLPTEMKDAEGEVVEVIG
jgi:hypothetical protein